MEQIALAGTDLVISRVGLGGCPLGGHGWGETNHEELAAAVRRALERGVNFFDTADIYGLGRSEELLSDALGRRRHEVVLASKFGVVRTADGRTLKDSSPAHLRTALEASLRRLRVECIPLYYVHWPDERTPVEETIAELDRCRQAGKIRAIGVSNFSAEQLRRACATARIAAVQVQYSLVDRQHAEALCEVIAAEKIPLVTWGSLAQGLLTGKFDARARFGANDRRSRYENFVGQKFPENLQTVERLKAVASRLGKSPAQTAIRWLLDTPGVGCVLFGAKRPQQVDDNVGAIGWQLDPADYQSLEGCSHRAAA